MLELKTNLASDSENDFMLDEVVIRLLSWAAATTCPSPRVAVCS